MKRFKHISQYSHPDDGLWVHITKEGYADVICFECWRNLDSSAIPLYGNYNIQAGTVDLTADPTEALKIYGWAINADGNICCPTFPGIITKKNTQYGLIVIECMWSYGQKDVVLDVSGNNRRKLFKEAREAL